MEKIKVLIQHLKEQDLIDLCLDILIEVQQNNGSKVLFLEDRLYYLMQERKYPNEIMMQTFPDFFIDIRSFIISPI